MLDFQLFRIKVYPSKQLEFFRSEMKPQEILSQTIRSLPSVTLGRNIKWHIGNLIELDSHGLYFLFGRTSKSTLEFFKEGNFIDQQFETAPYTHIIIDTNLEVCAIARRARLSRTTRGIANQLIRLLNNSQQAKSFKADFEINELLDPEDFIVAIRNAMSISKFWVTFSRPNPWDQNDDFMKPMARLLKETDGESGKTELKGNNLSPDNLEKLSRSAASTGNDAAAWIVTEDCPSRKTIKHLKGNPVSVSQEDLSDKPQRKKLLCLIREVYSRVRRRAEDN